jgi:ribosomal protein S18 acetylase RimI-like enzyme
MDFVWRPLTLDDAQSLAELFAEAEALDPIGEHYSAEDLREELTGPHVDLAEGSTSAWDGGKLVAYAVVSVRDAADPVHQVRIESLVRPGYRDDAIGEYLVDWFSRAGARRHERTFPGAPLELHAGAAETQRWYAGVLEAGGFHHARSFVKMRADLDDLPPTPPLPEDHRLVRFEQKYDELTRQARNDTFSGHWGSTMISRETWRHGLTGSKDFQPELSFLLLPPAGDEVVAFVLSAFYASDAAATGVRELYVSNVGTRAPLRGRGVATALLGHTLAEATARGFQRSSLGVDVDNASRALGIYERCGYRVTQSWAGYVRALT